MPNQPKSITSSTTKPIPTIQGPAPMLFIQKAAPMPISSSATEPTIGQCEGWGTK